jgi:cobalamin transport system substrate-binding protein
VGDSPAAGLRRLSWWCGAGGVGLLVALLGGCPASGPSPERPGPERGPRVITPAPAVAELICALGAEDQLVGVSRYCAYPPQLSELPRVGGMIDPNLEAIVTLRPDLVLTQGTNHDLVELCRRQGYRTVDFRIETVGDVLEATTELGALLDRSAEAAAEVQRLERALAGARARAPVPEDRLRVLLVINHQAGDLSQVSVPGHTTFLGECLQAAGGLPILRDLPGDRWHVVAKEVLYAEAPQVIIDLQVQPVDEDTARRLRADWERLEGLPAVDQGRIAVVSGSELLIPGPRLSRVVAKLERALAGDEHVDDGDIQEER